MASPWIQTSLPSELLPFLIRGPCHLHIPMPHSMQSTWYDGTHEALWGGSSSLSRSSPSSSMVVSDEDLPEGVVGTGSGMKGKKTQIACGFCRGRCIG